MYDIIIKNCKLFGLENRGSKDGDIAIKDGLIAKIGELPADAEAATTIDGSGLYTMPGFIDSHSHSDYYLMFDPDAGSKIMQGVTTEVGGNCGYSSCPIDGEILRIRKEAYKEQFGLELDWQNFEQYWQRLSEKGSAVNYLGLIGYNTLRGSVVGPEDLPVTAAHMARMKELVRENLLQGAAGMSIGLVYPPACFATIDEVAEVASELKPFGKPLTAHIRSEGAGLLEALEEIITIAKKADVKLQISHLKTAGKANWHKLEKAFALIENGIADGMDIECDRYPYTASNTGLQVVLPDWAFDGGRDKIIERLKDSATRDKFKQEILNNHPEPEYWDTVMVSQVVTEANGDLQGLTVTEGAAKRGKDIFDYVFDLLIEEKTEVEAIYFCMSEQNMEQILKKDYVMLGSDSGARTINGPLSIGRPHPRTFGSFPRFYREFVFDKQLFNMSEAVWKTSTAAAKRFNIKKRGQLIEGYFADIVMIDPEKILDKSSYKNPLAYPEGVVNVFVNGKQAVKHGKMMGEFAGRGLRIE